MKKLFPVLLCLGLVVQFCACANANATKESENAVKVAADADVGEKMPVITMQAASVDTEEVIEQPMEEISCLPGLPEDDLKVYDLFAGKWYVAYDLSCSISIPKEMPVGSVLIRSEDGTYVTLQIKDGECRGTYTILQGTTEFKNHWVQLKYAPEMVTVELASKQQVGSYVRNEHSMDYTQEYMESLSQESRIN